LPITLDDGINHFAALHTALCRNLKLAGAVHQIDAEVAHHQAATSGARQLSAACFLCDQ
jgi:hypothetical protein